SKKIDTSDTLVSIANALDMLMDNVSYSLLLVNKWSFDIPVPKDNIESIDGIPGVVTIYIHKSIMDDPYGINFFKVS
ncbi:MAG: hypothetical protein AABY07_02765, partial [Nanoarchaeota archaeon]